MPKFIRRKFRLVIVILIICACGRVKDDDEIVLNEMIIEKSGKYYYGDCDQHATTFYTGTDTFYENGNVRGTFTIKNGLPDGHWKQFNSDGTKKIDLYFDNGKLIKKEFNK